MVVQAVVEVGIRFGAQEKVAHRHGVQSLVRQFPKPETLTLVNHMLLYNVDLHTLQQNVSWHLWCV